MPRIEKLDVPPAVLVRLRNICLKFPQCSESEAWVGTRWRIGKKTFAHVLIVNEGWPPAYAKAAKTDGPACVLTFRSQLPLVDDETFRKAPFFKPVWWPDIVGVMLDNHTDWNDIALLLETSYRLLAPKT